MYVEFDEQRGEVRAGGARAAYAPAGRDGEVRAGGTVVRPVTFAERSRAVATARAASQPEATLYSALRRVAVVGDTALDGDLLDVVVLALAGADVDGAPPFAETAVVVLRSTGGELRSLLTAPAIEVDRLAVALAPGDDDGWTRVAFGGAAPTVASVRERLAAALLGRAAVAVGEPGREPAGPADDATSPRALASAEPAQLTARAAGAHGAGSARTAGRLASGEPVATGGSAATGGSIETTADRAADPGRDHVAGSGDPWPEAEGVDSSLRGIGSDPAAARPDLREDDATARPMLHHRWSGAARTPASRPAAAPDDDVAALRPDGIGSLREPHHAGGRGLPGLSAAGRHEAPATAAAWSWRADRSPWGDLAGTPAREPAPAGRSEATVARRSAGPGELMLARQSASVFARRGRPDVVELDLADVLARALQDEADLRGLDR